MTLTADQFSDFYRAVNGYPPFPWQKELVKRVVAHGGLWPAILDLPTSAGKTSALDAAIFLLAMQAGKSVHDRTAAMRTFFVVDRRIVVDEAAEKARNLARLLNVADDKPDAAASLQAVTREQRRMEPGQSDPLSSSDVAMIRAVASGLRQYGGEKALHVSVLRGGMYRDGSWAESPTQPTICLSTVDQVGSRLLFRGYGVSPYQRAVHAGLVGNDALILVDEAHLSRPFIETLKAVEFYRSARWADRPVKTPFQVIVMSATAGHAAQPVGAELEAADKQRPPSLKLDDRTDKNPDVCPELVRRLTAVKFAELDTALVEKSDAEPARRAKFARRLADRAVELAGLDATVEPPETMAQGSTKGKKPKEPKKPIHPPATVIGIVVNRVDTARRVYGLLRAEVRRRFAIPDEKPDDHAVLLLTGRIRPYDRDELLFRTPALTGDIEVRGWLPFMKATANKDRTGYGRPAPPRGVLFVVATQTVEVGADLSFDALVTEVAPLDSLRQRFGRLDRLGFRRESHAVIVGRSDRLKAEDDPVYGDRVKATWAWLGEHLTGTGKNKRIDFGIDALATRLPADLASLCALPLRAPVMMPSHVDDWVQTSGSPEPDPDPALFLHGPNSGPADVSVVWRADVTKGSLDKEVGKKDAPKARRVVALVPPTSMEALSLPIWHVRSWLRDQSAPVGDFTDLEGEPEPEPDRRRAARKSKPFLIWKGPDRKHGTLVSSDPDDISPGNTIIVPSDYGGCDDFGWNPDHRGRVNDIADDCTWRAKLRPVLRVHPESRVHLQTLAIWQRIPDSFPVELAARLPGLLVADVDTGEVDWGAVAGLFRELPGGFGWLRNARRFLYPDGSGAVFVGRKRTPYPDDPNAFDVGEDAPADDEGNSFLGSDGLVPLEDHCRSVQARVDAFARNLGLADDSREIVSRAALLHDPGKADPRFQEWLYGSEGERARHAPLLIAKSRAEGKNAAAVEEARARAGWPKGARHEAGSVLLARGNPEVFAGLGDSDLCEYLIGAHHGRGRPVWPFAEDDEPVQDPGTVPVELGGFTLSARLPPRPETELAALHAGWVDLFWRLVRRYGYWGLAYLETLIVLADHRQSEAERNAGRENP